jgi:hypothetical protein
MTDWWGRFLDAIGLQRKTTDETAVNLYRGKQLMMERLSPREAAERAKTAALREETARSNERAAGHMLGTVQKAAEIEIVTKRTQLTLEQLDTEIDEAIADGKIAEETRPERDEVKRAKARTEVNDARAAERMSEARAFVTDLDARRIVEEAQRKYDASQPPDPNVVAAQRSREEQEAADREWALHIVLEVSAWTYPINDEEGYRAYAATQYFGPRLDEGRTHEEALAIAAKQLLTRKQILGPIRDTDIRRELERRALAMWKNWKKRRDANEAEDKKKGYADILADAARVQHEAAELLHQTINGRDPNEDFDPTK